MQELLFSRSSEAFLCRFNFAGLIIIYYLRRHHRVGRRISTEYGNLFHASQMSHCILFQQLLDSIFTDQCMFTGSICAAFHRDKVTRIHVPGNFADPSRF